ncbi:hypothetical protein WJX72_007376 [[Myrmecia] bisecta]|uniref:Uncharacterized protein n=1 Tax=[Myrmecia] bisecta TaxID=41462 RepID=A0AAW1QR69_9CHLO
MGDIPDVKPSPDFGAVGPCHPGSFWGRRGREAGTSAPNSSAADPSPTEGAAAAQPTRWRDQLRGLAVDQLTDTHAQLRTIEFAIRGRLYREYLQQCEEIAPSLQIRGRMVGDQLLATLLRPTGCAGSIVYRAAAKDASSTAASSAATSAAGSAEPSEALMQADVLQRLDPLLAPVMQPFVEGVSQPFLEAYDQVKVTAIATLVASSLVSCAIGYFLGRSGFGKGFGKGGH